MYNKLQNLTFFSLGITAVCLAGLSLRWPMAGDQSYYLYLSYLMEHFHYVPYKDFFDLQLPGTYLIHCWIGCVLGFDSFHFYAFNLACLAGVLAATAYFMQATFGPRSATAAVTLFACSYLLSGINCIGQREFFLLLPVSAALASCVFPGAVTWRALIAGFFFGAAATVKPHVVLLAPVILFFMVKDRRELRPAILSMALGGIMPIAGVFFYLKQSGAWPYLADIVKNYWPIYNRLSSGFEQLSGMARMKNLFHGYTAFGGKSAWLVPASAACVLAFFHLGVTPKAKRAVLFLAVFIFAASLYALTGGKFFEHHWLFFLYGAILLASACFADGIDGRIPARTFLLALVLFSFASSVGPAGLRGLRAQGDTVPTTVADITKYLETKASPGDRVQVLDSGLGGIESVLRERLETATPFVLTKLLDDNDSIYVKAKRSELLSRMHTVCPRFVVETRGWHVPFPEFQELLSTRYRAAEKNERYTVYERI